MPWELFEVGRVVSRFRETADQDMLDAFDARADALRTSGNLCRAPVSKHLRDKIFELIVRAGKDQMRFLYYFDNPRRIVFVRVFVKKTQKTPPDEIEKAIRIRNDTQKNERAENVSRDIN